MSNHGAHPGIRCFDFGRSGGWTLWGPPGTDRCDTPVSPGAVFLVYVRRSDGARAAVKALRFPDGNSRLCAGTVAPSIGSCALVGRVYVDSCVVAL